MRAARDNQRQLGGGWICSQLFDHGEAGAIAVHVDVDEGGGETVASVWRETNEKERAMWLAPSSADRSGYCCETVPRQAPVSWPRASMNFLKRSRSPCRRRLMNPSLSPIDSTKFAGS